MSDHPHNPTSDLEAVQDWTCPICCELLYKPCANACGHLFCFWCLHKAMSPFSTSKCPMCRATFGHFPAILAPLHAFLKASFPEEYARRTTETAAEEAAMGSASPALDGVLPVSGCTAAVNPADFACDVCSLLLHRPACLVTCGHWACSDTCLGADATGGSRCICRKCGSAMPRPPAVCKQLDELLRRRFPAQQVQRAADVAAAALLQAESMETDQANAAPAADPAVAPPLTTATDGAAPEAAHPAGTAAPAFLSRAPFQQAMNPATYTHFGVGCDRCGM